MEMKLHAVPFYLIACLAVIAASCTPHDNIAPEEVLRIHRDKFGWLADADTSKLAELLSDDVRYIHSNGWVERKADVLANAVNGTLTYNEVEVLEEEARVFGNTAVVVGTGIFDIVYKGVPMAITLNYTEVYVLSENGLKLVSRHACKPANTSE